MRDNKPVNNYTVIIDGKPATTDDSGIFETVVSNTTSQVKVQPSDQQYVIIYPQGGKILIPKDPSLITEIIIGNFKSNEYLKEYLTVSKQLKDSIGKSKIELQTLHTTLDSVVAILHQLNYTETDLRSAKEIQEGKDRNFYDLTKDLEDYSRNASNLLTAFKYVSDYAFTNPNALEQLSEAIRNYNLVYDRLDGKNIYYQKIIGDYWGDAQQKEFKEIANYILMNIHQQKIYPLTEVIQQIRSYFTNNKNDQNLKTSIQTKISNAATEIEPIINQLDNQIKKFTQSLFQ